MENQNATAKFVMENQNATAKIAEEQLEAVTGGGRTQNRYSATECRGLSGPITMCKSGSGFFDGGVWCDHYRESEVRTKIEGGRKIEYRTLQCLQNGFPKHDREGS
ncbi:MAG: hypothetical protein FWG87_10475 [Defluviitaleaceae bacterium]|nr:hypothetical protein [Defluviitaleaceae bacterium]